MLPNFSYVRPRTLDEALAALADGDARIHAGGTDLLGCLHDGVFGADSAGQPPSPRRAARDRPPPPTAGCASAP